MKTLIVIIVLFAGCAMGWGRNDWYAPPIEVAPGTTLIDSLPANAANADVHARLQHLSKGAAHWQLCWSKSDNDNYVMAEVSLPDQRIYDDIYVPEATIDVVEVKNGVPTPLVSANISVSDATMSVKLVYDGFSARLYAGSKDKQLIGTVPFDARKGGAVEIVTDQRFLAHRLTAQSYSSPAPVYSQAEIESALDGNADLLVGRWTYLDREVETKLASLGGKYDLAILPAQAGEYEIVYLGGANINADLWERPRLKGLLRATGFLNNYDLLWYDAAGHLLDDDNNAQLTDDGSILTLKFPVYKSQLRFKRAK